MPSRIVVAISGRGSNLRALHAGLDPAAARVTLVLSDRADAPGLAWAREQGIPTHALADHRDAAEWIARLEAAGADLIVLAGYLKLVPADVIGAYRGRIVNIHPSLLPAFGGHGMYGMRVHRAVLASGAVTSGATVHLVDEVYDRGAILARREVPVLPGDTAETLADRVLAAEHRLLPAVVRAAVAAGHPVPLAPEPAHA